MQELLEKKKIVNFKGPLSWTEITTLGFRVFFSLFIEKMIVMWVLFEG